MINSDIVKLYVDPFQRYKACWNLVRIGADIFHKAKIIKELNEFEKACEFATNGSQAYTTSMVPFVTEYIVDAFRISLFFESLGKASLLKQGFLIHDIGDKLDALKKKQQKMPIRFEEHPILLLSNGTLRETTIKHHVMSKASYKKIIDTPEVILMQVKELNKSRNRLHFMNYHELAHSPKFITGLRGMIEYVDEQVRLFRTAPMPWL